MAQWAHYSIPNEEYLRVLAEQPPAPDGSDDADQSLIKTQVFVAQTLRKRVEDAGPLTVEEKRLSVSTPPGEIIIRVYTPESQHESETFPLYIQIHGGGFYIGSIDMDELFCREISTKHRLVVVNIEYRLAPQFPFPTGVEDSYEAVKWVASNASSIRADLKRGFILGGISSGAHLVCVVTQRARNDPDLQGKVTGQVLQIPSTIVPKGGIPERFKDKIISREQNKNDPILTPDYLVRVQKAYKVNDPTDARASPLLTESFAGLPPAYVQVAGADPLRDEGLLYHQLMQDAGVSTKLDIYTGVPHGFAQYYSQLEISAKWRSDLDSGIKWLLEFAKY